MEEALEVLIDADAAVSLFDNNDRNHKAMASLFEKLRKNHSFLMTSFAFGETLTVISQNAGLALAVSAAGIIEETVVILEVDGALRRKGLEIFRKQKSKNARFTDCVNMALLKDLGQDKIFSFDEHYQKNGFKRLGIEAKV